MKSALVRAVSKKDLPLIKSIIDETKMFPSDMLDEMISPFFNDSSSQDFWLTYDDGEPLAIAYCSPEKMTEGTWNLLLIAVSPNVQGKGIGNTIMAHIETILADKGERLLLVETSSLEEFALTRQFYLNCQYTEEARIRDYYQQGEDKVVFWKNLQAK